MIRRATLVITMAFFLVSPFAYAEPRSDTPAVPEAQGGPAPAKRAPAAVMPAPAPVVLEGKTLFYIKETVSPGYVPGSHRVVQGPEGPGKEGGKR